MVREFLRAVNSESGRTENRFNLLQLDQALVFKQGEQVVRELLALVGSISLSVSTRTFDSRKRAER
jgi:hypothetical protein